MRPRLGPEVGPHHLAERRDRRSVICSPCERLGRKPVASVWQPPGRPLGVLSHRGSALLDTCPQLPFHTRGHPRMER